MCSQWIKPTSINHAYPHADSRALPAAKVLHIFCCCSLMKERYGTLISCSYTDRKNRKTIFHMQNSTMTFFSLFPRPRHLTIVYLCKQPRSWQTQYATRCSQMNDKTGLDAVLIHKGSPGGLYLSMAPEVMESFLAGPNRTVKVISAGLHFRFR